MSQRSDDRMTPAVRSDLVAESVDGELLVFDPVRNEVHQLNPMGALVWQFLDGSATVDELVGDLADAFDAPPDQVRADLTALLDQLAEEHLLEPYRPAAEAPAQTDITPDGYLVDPPAH